MRVRGAAVSAHHSKPTFGDLCLLVLLVGLLAMTLAAALHSPFDDATPSAADLYAAHADE